MKKCLMTAFEPFGGQKINASLETLKLIPEVIGTYQIIKVICPVIFKQSFDHLKEKIDTIKPDVIIMLGEAGGRKSVSIERIAINIQDARIPDHLGYQPKHQPIEPTGPDGYFTLLPYQSFIDSLKDEGFDIALSNSAGTYVCNDLMYRVLHEIKEKNLPISAGFIHVPYGPSQTSDDHMPTKTFEENASLIKHLIACL